MRHGKTRFNDPANPIVRAWIDEPLSDEGRLDAQLLANKLAKYSPQYMYSSDFMRDTETSEILASRLNISGRETDFDARTWDLGAYSGRPAKEVNEAIKGLYDRPWEVPPGSSESFNDFSTRWTAFLEAKLDYACKIPAHRPPIIVTHGRNIALSQAHYDGIMFQDARMPFPAGFAVISVADDRSVEIDLKSPTESVVEDV